MTRSSRAAKADWDPAAYARFHEERLQPARELLDRLPADVEPGRIVDAGCGAGAVTALLAERFGDAGIRGIDDSEAMLDEARQAVPSARFVRGDAATWQPSKPVDLVVANAVLHWMPDHAAVLRHWLGWLGPGGVLAVQLPANFDAPGHQAIRAVAAEGPWALALAAARHGHALPLDEYRSLLERRGCDVDAWDTVYEHGLADVRALVDWFQGTTLRPFLAELDEGRHEAFLAALGDRLAAAFPGSPIRFPFCRRFFVARLPRVAPPARDR